MILFQKYCAARLPMNCITASVRNIDRSQPFQRQSREVRHGRFAGANTAARLI